MRMDHCEHDHQYGRRPHHGKLAQTTVRLCDNHIRLLPARRKLTLYQDKTGRKPLMLFGVFGCCASLTLEAVSYADILSLLPRMHLVS